MKLFTRIVVLLLSITPLITEAQITTPVIKANFGIDGELRANFFNGFVQSGNDDWFNNGTAGTGQFIIDTAGAAAILARYAIDPNFRRLPFYRTMRYPQFSVVNNRLLVDAIFIRDYHGDDSTIFASGSNKNGMSPANWSCPVSQSIPDKNEILDMMVHVRRAGPNKTDSLWMYGGLSIESTTGDRYYDFEMYQTDIYYDRASRQFYNYGPQAGHTAWLFDAAGNVTRAGDIVFTTEWGTAGLSLVEARIWIDRASLSIDPTNFDWVAGKFDGASAGAQYGYQAILGETAGPFYMGVMSPNNTWAGPFSLVIGNNTLQPNYIAKQFLEFGVNLTKLGLDPVTLLGGDVCGMPFRRILVKTRASSSFTAELKDFVGPFDFFLAPRADAAADIPTLCDAAAVSTISVTNPSPTSDYTWTTPNGHIITPPFGPSIMVDDDGMYIVTQRLQAGCSIYAIDTVYIQRDLGCQILKNGILNFSGVLNNRQVTLKWSADKNDQLAWFDVERSTNGYDFVKVGRVEAKAGTARLVDYSFPDNLDDITSPQVYYRLSVRAGNGATAYSTIIRLMTSERGPVAIAITPNPVKESMQISIRSNSNQLAQYRIIDAGGKILHSQKISLLKGNNVVSFSDVENWSTGVYNVQVLMSDEVFNQKFVLVK